MDLREKFQKLATRLVDKFSEKEYTFIKRDDIEYDPNTGSNSIPPEADTVTTNAALYNIKNTKIGASYGENTTVIVVDRARLEGRTFYQGDHITSDTDHYIIQDIDTDQYEASYFFTVTDI